MGVTADAVDGSASSWMSIMSSIEEIKENKKKE